MNYFIFILVAALLISDVNCGFNTFPTDANGCRYFCKKDEYCDKLCKEKGAEGGHCAELYGGCWCINLYDYYDYDFLDKPSNPFCDPNWNEETIALSQL
uniref:NaTx n=1 Tax=Centruroides hentzi TaxID=88313 RepID=A0A2I9LPD4_9SCOR